MTYRRSMKHFENHGPCFQSTPSPILHSHDCTISSYFIFSCCHQTLAFSLGSPVPIYVIESSEIPYALNNLT